MKKRVFVILLACAMLVGTAACGKDTKKDSNVEAQNTESSESFVGLTVESSVSIEISGEEEGAFAP